MRNNVLIVGAGGVAHVAAHKCAQHNDIFGDICIASRNIKKCDEIINSVLRKNSIKDKSKKLFSRQLDALKIQDTIDLIKETESSIVINLGSAFINMSVLEACIETGVTYLDTAIHEEPDRVASICEPPPWYGNYEWKRKDRCTKKGMNAILGVGFDPGVVNAYCKYAVRHLGFSTIDTIDILDVNAGSHGKFFATNFDPEINFREFTGDVTTWINRKWETLPTFTTKMTYDFPVVGKQLIYLTGHDELHSLSKNIDANTIRFWMGFSDHYINCFNVLNNIGLLSVNSVNVEGVDIVPLKVVKACLPDPKTLAPDYIGKTCIGCLVKGKDEKNLDHEIFIYNVCDHKECYLETESQAISYTAGVPVTAAALLVANGTWNPKTMVNVEELDPVPFIELLNVIGLPTEIKYI
ncbi:MAG: saccharopine dehydrogenase family protein [Nitrosarchaeum sp.]|nr:saccharopine dehydrogenase family protein [Nitrosarchaeum sp.]